MLQSKFAKLGRGLAMVGGLRLHILLIILVTLYILEILSLILNEPTSNTKQLFYLKSLVKRTVLFKFLSNNSLPLSQSFNFVFHLSITIFVLDHELISVYSLIKLKLLAILYQTLLL